MTVKQISVFVSNSSGGIAEIVEKLSENGINIRALSVADTADFGILRLIVDDYSKTIDVLKNSGYVSSVTDVLAVRIADCPGGLSGILKILAAERLDIEYIYAFVTRNEENAFAVFRMSDNGKAIEVLTQNGISLVSGEEIYKL